MKKSTKHCLLRIAAWSLVAGLAGACVGGGTQFPTLSRAPLLPELSIPDPPEAPKPVADKSADLAKTAPAVDALAVRPLPEFRQLSLGLGVLDDGATATTPEAPGFVTSLMAAVASQGNAGAAVHGTTVQPGKAPSGGRLSEMGIQGIPNQMLRHLLSANISRVVDLSSVGRGVVVTIAQTGNTRGAAANQTVYWSGTFDRMAHVGKVSGADYVLYGELENATSRTVSQELRTRYVPVELEAYTTSLEAWRQSLKAQEKQVYERANPWMYEYQNAVDAYRASGRAFPPWHLPHDSSEMQAYHNAQALEQSMQSALSQLQGASANVPPIETLLEAAAEDTTSQPLLQVDMTLVFKLLEVSSGEIVWFAKVVHTDMAPADQSTTSEALLGQLFDEMLAAMFGQLLANSRPSPEQTAAASEDMTEQEQRRAARKARKERESATP